MSQLTETNCEVRKTISFELPLWKSSDFQVQDGTGQNDASNDPSFQHTLGGFLNSDCNYAWMSCNKSLIVVDVSSGEYVSTWTFSDKITTVSAFPAQQGCVPLLLVGLDNDAIRIKDSVGQLCIFDCCTCKILTTIQVPAGVEKACVIHGGADWEDFNEKRPDTALPDNSGLIFVALRNLQHIMIDINRDLWSKSCYGEKPITACLEFVNTISSSAVLHSKSNKVELTYLAHDLLSKEIEQYIGFDRQDFEATPLYDESLCTVLLSSTKIGCLVTGCLGRVIIWHFDGSIAWISPTFDENAYVTQAALLEPSDDPKPFYYLWIVCQGDAPDSVAVLRMYMLMFKNKINDKSGENSSLYFNLESDPSLKFELELEQNERVHSLVAIERGNPRDASDVGSRRGEDSLLLIGTEERVLLFDLNRWYKEQMPCTMSGCRNPNSILACYKTRQDEVPREEIISCLYKPRTLREFPNKSPHSPEELFFPNSLKFEWVDLTEKNLVFWLTRGVQSELLREITMAGPIVLVMPTETYRRCLCAGLVPFDSAPQDYSLEVEQSVAREMLLSLCLEQRWANFLLRCAIEWSDGSAAYLYSEFLRWSVKRASEIKLMTDRLCVPLFDQSGTNIGESEVRTLRYCVQQLECLVIVVSKLPNAQVDLAKHRRALKRIATYLQVVLWFYDVGLLPEIQDVDEDDDMQISAFAKIPYPRNKLIESYKRKRRNDCNEENKEDDILFIDQMIARNCLPLKVQWKQETDSDCPNQGGLYPPPSIQSLLRSFLTDCYCEEKSDEEEEEEDSQLPETFTKHCIVIYLLMDLCMILKGTNPAVDRLIEYPAAFKLSPSLIKLTQAFWLLDHEDYDCFFNIMTSQIVSSNDIKDWQHKLALNSLLKNDQHKLALNYLLIIKPPLSSADDQGIIIDLAVEQGLVELAFHARPPSHYGQLLTRFFHACKTHGKLKDILRLTLDPEEEKAFDKYLQENGNEEIRLIHYLLRGRYTEANNIFSINSNFHLYQSMAGEMNIQSNALNLLKAFNKTLPEITKLFANSLSKNTTTSANGRQFVPYSMMTSNNERRGFYPKPMSQSRDETGDIYDLAVRKTRETCLRPDRGGLGTSNYIPFLTPPCATINFGPKFASQINGEGDATCVTYPKRKVFTGKRTLRTMIGSVESVNDEIDKKRRKLNDESRAPKLNDSDQLESVNSSDPLNLRRLSMSQVCSTPLVRRKETGKMNNLYPETPHSILKIRRKSRSPSYNFAQGDVIGEEDMSRTHLMPNNFKSLRQIHFSVDRLSGNDNTSLSAYETHNEEDTTGSSKNTGEESRPEESYHSPNLTEKSFRDKTILSETSMVYLGGPRPRPSLRRSDSNNSSDTSVETSQSKVLSTLHSVEPDENESEESVEQPEEDTQVVTKVTESEFDKECLLDRDQEKEEKKYQEHYEMEVDEEEDCERLVSTNTFRKANTSKDHQQLENLEERMENSEEDLDDESFQSISNSFVEKAEKEDNGTQLRDTSGMIQNEEYETDRSFDENRLTENLIPDERDDSIGYSLTKPIFINSQGIVGFQDEKYDITDDESIDGEENVPHISIKLTRVTEVVQKDEENDFVLSFSNSDSSGDGQRKVKNLPSKTVKEKSGQLQNVEKKHENQLKNSFISEEQKLSPESNLSRKNQVILEPKKKVSPRRSIRSVSTSSLLNELREDCNILTLPNNPLFESTGDDNEEQSGKSASTKPTRGRPKKVVKSPESSKLTPQKSTTRTTRAGSSSKDVAPTAKSTRKTRAASITKENVGSETDEMADQQLSTIRSSRVSTTQKNTSIIADKRTKAGSVSKDDEQVTSSSKKTRATSVLANNDLPSAHTRSRITKSVGKDEKELTKIRSTRAGSISNDEQQPTITRKKRAGSVAKENDQTTSTAKEDEKPSTRKTRASSLSKETSKDVTDVSTVERRSTRASSIAKDNPLEEQEVRKKQTSKKRGSSLPKEIPCTLKVTKQQGVRSSVSLMKEVIPEESGSFTESPVRTENIRAPQTTKPSSSIPKTRSRRSSIQSVPGDLEEILNVPDTIKSTGIAAKRDTIGRGRRATSVDSVVSVPAGRRVTRSSRTKATINEVIPEELTPVKQPRKRRRATSVSSNEAKKVEVLDKLEHVESNDYKFSSPEKGEDVPGTSEGGNQTPTFEFSHPAGLQKFLTPIRFDEEYDDEATNVLEQGETGNVKKPLAKTQRQPRTCFVMPKMAKNKGK
ncbi:uncharacterized protein LOC106641698 [Copidosoma floridanum]|uniref:uncharacterized protein LOC106641698 n=1 Tax=Copidosoma floridanum TaxID=29053 RepID=UPI0006C96242|nr:uncharacterized protein LOC106641698 [Copidosoma floridanum]